jgi:Fic family protein
MGAIYLHQRPDWPNFHFDGRALLEPVADAATSQGLLIGRLDGLGFGELQDAKLDAISDEVTQSSAIEGERLDYDLVRSSIARRLGVEEGGVPSGDHRVEGVVEMAIDAAERAELPLDSERLFRWHAGLFPGGMGTHGRIRVGAWRNDAEGPMVVASGPAGRERIHYEAPPADRLESEMHAFLDWYENGPAMNGILKAGLAHLWFVTIHPFDDGNGRIGRAILDMALARSDRRKWRCYSVSAQIRRERKEYYDALERAQKGTLDATPWLAWYLGCLTRALDGASATVSSAIYRTRFWSAHSDKPLNERQRKAVQRMLMGWEGKMTRKKWMSLFGVSESSAKRDMAELVELAIFRVGEEGGRSTSYELIPIAKG